MKSDYIEKREARIARLHASAEKNHTLALETQDRARAMADVIPLGQPILIGHHSEKRDRNYRERIGNTFQKASDLEDKARYQERRAQAAETGHAISSDHPDAIPLLKAKLERLQRDAGIAKAANKIIRSKETDDQKIAALIALRFTEGQARELLKPDYMGRIGFASYVFQNNNQEQHRIQKRIELLERQATETTTEKEIQGVRLVDNVEENRIQVFFPDIPSEGIRRALKGSGFKWAPSVGCWQAYRGGGRLQLATQILCYPKGEY
jgi:hypothetical protein